MTRRLRLPEFDVPLLASEVEHHEQLAVIVTAPVGIDVALARDPSVGALSQSRLLSTPSEPVPVQLEK